jgi:hypothetical protein
MQIEQPKDASTPEEMRAEISRLRHFDPMVRAAMDLADYHGLSGEDRYVVLAYQALRAKSSLMQQCIDKATNTVYLPPFLF